MSMYWLITVWGGDALLFHELWADESEANSRVEELTKNYRVEIEEIEAQ